MTDEKSKKIMMDKKIMKSMRKFLLAYNRSIKDELVHAPSRMRQKSLLKYFKNNIKTRKSTGGNTIFRTFTHKENGFKQQYSFKLPKEKKEKKEKVEKVKKKKPKKKIEKKRNPRSKGPTMKKGPPTTRAEYKKERLAKEKKIKAAKKKMLEDEAKRYKKA